MPEKRKTLLIVVVVFVALLIIVFLLKPEWIQKTWQWFVGLAGLVALGFKRLIAFLSGGKELKDIETENNLIKSRLSEIDAEMVAAKSRLQRERELHQREIELIEKRMALREVEIKNELDYVKKIQSMGYKEYLDHLTTDERDKLLKDNIIDLP